VADNTLYCFAQSGNAYKAALMLNLCGANRAPRFVDFFHGETRTPEFRAIYRTSRTVGQETRRRIAELTLRERMRPLP
jgi:hypothetical protein